MMLDNPLNHSVIEPANVSAGMISRKLKTIENPVFMRLSENMRKTGFNKIPTRHPPLIYH
jgi:hypothetical protein